MTDPVTVDTNHFYDKQERDEAAYNRLPDVTFDDIRKVVNDDFTEIMFEAFGPEAIPNKIWKQVCEDLFHSIRYQTSVTHDPSGLGRLLPYATDYILSVVSERADDALFKNNIEDMRNALGLA